MMRIDKFETMSNKATLIADELLKDFSHPEALAVLEMAKELIKAEI